MTRALRLFTATGAMRAWATTLLVIVCFGLGLGFTIGYVKKVDRDADRRDRERSREICDVVVFIDDRQQKLTPTNEDQRQFYEKWHSYRLRLGC